MNSDSEDDDFIPQFENESPKETKRKDNKRQRDKKLLTLDDINVKSSKIQKTDSSSPNNDVSNENSIQLKETEATENKTEDDSDILAMFSKGVKAKKTGTTKKIALPKSWLNDNDEVNNENEKDKLNNIKIDEKEETSLPKEQKSSLPLKEVVKETKYTYMGEEVIIDEPESNLKKKPVSNLSALLNEVKGKNKLSSLQKSKYDWKKYTSDENIEIELEQNKKNGYIQKLSFLQQTDLKQFELEKEVRERARNRSSR